MQLEEIRKKRNMSREELAKKCDTSRQTIRNIECGETNPTLKLCLKICKALDKTLDDVFWDEG